MLETKKLKINDAVLVKSNSRIGCEVNPMYNSLRYKVQLHHRIVGWVVQDSETGIYITNPESRWYCESVAYKLNHSLQGLPSYG
jgi:hypothetical protein